VRECEEAKSRHDALVARHQTALQDVDAAEKASLTAAKQLRDVINAYIDEQGG